MTSQHTNPVLKKLRALLRYRPARHRACTDPGTKQAEHVAQFLANGAYSQTASKPLDHAHEKLLSIREKTSANRGLDLTVALT